MSEAAIHAEEKKIRRPRYECRSALRWGARLILVEWKDVRQSQLVIRGFEVEKNGKS